MHVLQMFEHLARSYPFWNRTFLSISFQCRYGSAVRSTASNSITQTDRQTDLVKSAGAPLYEVVTATDDASRHCLHCLCVSCVRPCPVCP